METEKKKRQQTLDVFMKSTCTVVDTGTIKCDSEDSAAIEPERNDTSKYSEVDAVYGPIPTCSESPMTTESQPSEVSVSLTDVGHFVAAGGMSKLKDAEKIKLLDTHWKHITLQLTGLTVLFVETMFLEISMEMAWSA